ncbi:hypothetical protein CNEO4_390083 [Clostridium neonatale]|nr:hypothetical protein CNEO4_390083 [Clostridium neonatale]
MKLIKLRKGVMAALIIDFFKIILKNNNVFTFYN